MTEYLGIAFGGRKGNGKSLLADYLCRTRKAVIMPSKTPIVQAFEKWSGRTYDKGRDDQQLIRFSTEIARAKNPNLVADWLEVAVPATAKTGAIPIVPDMRFFQENRVLRRLGMLCIKVDARESTRQARTIARDGDLRNYDPYSPTEVDIDRLTYDTIIDNDRDDNGAWAIEQLESILRDVTLLRFS
jgi:dephospho-CoA kinase